MIFKIREKFWSWGGSFTITDENDVPKYIVKGEAFSWGHKLSFQNIQGEELAFINQKLLSWKQKYQILINGDLFAEMIKEFSWFKKQFVLDVPGPNDYSITGSFWQHEFEFERAGKKVAEINKNYWGWNDSYGVQIVDDEDEIAILCACIVIDQILNDEKNAAST